MLLLAGGVLAFRSSSSPEYRPHPASVQAFTFPTIAPMAPAEAPPTAVPIDPSVQRSADTALSAYLGARSAGDTATSYQLLAAESRQRFGSLASWVAGQGTRPRPVSFAVAGGGPRSPDSAEFRVDLRYQPALDEFGGLVPGRTTETYRVVRESGRWSVLADPTTVTPHYPADTGAGPVVATWLDRRVACDDAGARALQPPGELTGNSELAMAPCEDRGGWQAGAVQLLAEGPQTAPFLAAYGPGVGQWARLVPVQGPHQSFLVGVAPWGDDWRVFGIIPAATRGGG